MSALLQGRRWGELSTGLSVVANAARGSLSRAEYDY